MGDPLPPADKPRLLAAEVRRRVLASVGSDPDPAAYAELSTAMDAVPQRQRGPKWHEASILLDVRHRADAKRTQGRLAAYRSRQRYRGDAEVFERFYAVVQELLGSDTLTTHGYGRSLATRDPSRLWAEVASLCRAVEATGHPCFAVSGTLLGLVRGDGLIDHDTDVDLAVLLPGDSLDEVADRWRALRREIAHLLDPEFEALAVEHTKARSTDLVGIDLFPAWLEGDRVPVWPHTRGHIGRDSLLPLAAVMVAGSSIPVPREPEPFLIDNYGPDWRVPDPTWRFDWRAARRLFADALDALRSPQE